MRYEVHRAPGPKDQRCLFCNDYIYHPDPVCQCQVDDTPIEGDPTYEENWHLAL